MSKTSVSLRQHVNASFRDAVYTSLNIGMAESYFCAFMLAIGISDVISGLGTVIPQFIGVLFQLLSIRSFFTQYSLKKRLILFLGLQALSMIPLAAVAIYKINSPYLIISILSLYWASLLSLNPPWSRLIGHTIPESFRLKFSSIRSQFGQFSVFLGLIGAGLVLHWQESQDAVLPVYVGIFLIGFILKCCSIFDIYKNHQDYSLAPGTEKRLPLRTFLRRLNGTDQGKLITFLFLFYVAAHFASPYFGPFMLKELKLNYMEYMGITSVSYFGRVVMFKFLQKKARPKQVNTLLLIATLGISTSPLLWSVSQKFGWIIFIEFLSGSYWAAFELATILLYFQKIEDNERTSVMTYITLLNTSGMLLGSLLGALYMKILPIGWDHYLTLFVTSSILRAIVIVFAPQVDFKGQIPKLISFNRIMSVRPPYGAIVRPIVGKVRKKKEEKSKIG